MARQGLQVRPGLTIPADELQVRFSRAGGPGGQNVNKVATQVLLRVRIAGSAILGPDARARIRSRLGRRVSRDGWLAVRSSRHREQARNLEDARSRLATLLREALAERHPRRPSRPTEGSRERRLRTKRERSERKRARGWRPVDAQS